MIKKLSWFLVLVVLLSAAFQAAPVNEIQVTNAYYDKDSNTVTAFVSEPVGSMQLDSVSMTLGETELENVKFEAVNSSDMPVTTLILVDKSRDSVIGEKERPPFIIYGLMDNTVLNKADSNKIYVMQFDDKVGDIYEAENPAPESKAIVFDSPTADYFLALKSGLDYFVDRQNSGIREKQQIVLITDASHYAETSISAVQLKSKVEAASVPIYSVVTLNADGTVIPEDLQQISDFSKLSGGLTYNVQDSKNDEIVTGLIKTIVNSYIVTGKVPEAFAGNADGKYDLKVQLNAKDGVTAGSTWKMSIPELVMAETAETAGTASDTATADETVTADTGEAQVDGTEAAAESTGNMVKLFGKEISKTVLLVICGVILLALIVLLVFRSRKPAPVSTNTKSQVDSGGKTQVFAPSAVVTFTNLNKESSGTPVQAKIVEGQETTFGRVTDKQKGIIGLDADNTVSKVHFKVTSDKGILFIEDAASGNGTTLNGDKIQAKSRLNDNDILLLGDQSFRVHVK